MFLARFVITTALALCLLIGGFFIHPFLAFGQTSEVVSPEVKALNDRIAENRKKVEELEAAIANTNKLIATKQTQAGSLKNQLAILDAQKEGVELDIKLTEEKLDTITLELESLTLSIADKEKTLARQKTMIAELVRTLYYEDQKSVIEVMAAYSTFSDFYNRLYYLQTMEEDLGQSVRAMRLIKTDLETKKTQVGERKVAYQTLRETLENQKKDLREQTYSKENLLAETRASEMTYKTLLGNLRKQYQQIENEIVSIERQVRQRLEEQEKLKQKSEAGDTTFSWPTASRYITAKFRDPGYPYRQVFEHNAIDIRASQGTAVRAAGSGYVGRAKTCTSSSCYSYVMLLHSGGLSTVYGHLSRIVVTADQFVTKGDIIGYSGGTPGTVGAGPFVTGPHLHFEVREEGIPVNPVNFLP